MRRLGAVHMDEMQRTLKTKRPLRTGVYRPHLKRLTPACEGRDEKGPGRRGGTGLNLFTRRQTGGPKAT